MLKKIFIIFLLYLHADFAFAEIYKWMDEQGRVHYGDRPLANSTEMEIDNAKKSNVKISQSREESRQRLLNAYDEDNKRKAEEKAKSKNQKKELARRCSRSKDRLKSYERARYLYTVDKDGNRIAMSNEERDKATSRVKKNINKYCK